MTVLDLILTVNPDGSNPVAHDLHLTAGDFVWSEDFQEVTAQRLRIRLQFFKGEWFLDQREGVPYFQVILQKGTSDVTVKAIFSRVIRGCPGVAFVESLSYSLDHVTRTASLVFVARLVDGSTFHSRDFGPFIVEF